MAKVFIGVDPHKLSATIEVVDEHESVQHGQGRVRRDAQDGVRVARPGLGG
jgi:transposase